LTLRVAAARDRFLELGRWSVLLCLFSIPITKAGVNIFIFLALLFSALGSRSQQRFLAACKQPVVIGACLWFLALAISALHAPGGSDRWGSLGVYKALLYPLIVATLLETTQWRTRGLFALAISISLILLVSWAEFFNVVPMLEMAKTGAAYRYTVLREYTQQGIQFLVLAAIAASFAMTEIRIGRKRLLWLLAAAAFINVVFLLQSRTCYMIAVPLLLYWVWRAIGDRFSAMRKLALCLAGLALIGSAAFMTQAVQLRFEQARQDVLTYKTIGKTEATSIGIRLELWKRTLPMISSAPWFGHGTGQWPTEYQKQTSGLPDFAGFRMGHPHQEALSIMAEHGIVGLAVFVMLLIALARYINRLQAPHRDLYICLLLFYVVAALANCILLDFSHRHLFLMLLACIPFVPGKSDAPGQVLA
jgi:O-antigen ligase